MKKFISMLLVAAMALSLAACVGAASSTAASTAASSKAASSTAASSTAATGTTGKIALFVGDLGDNSFSDSANRGIEELKTKGWDATTIKTGPESNSDKYADIIQDAIDDGANYCVGSSSYHTMMVDLAKENKDVKFIVFDDQPQDTDEFPNNNVVFILYKQNEGSYLVGMLAAGMTKTKVVAVDVGNDNPVIGDFVTGFIQGVTDTDPTVKVVKATVGGQNPWSDPTTMKELCMTQFRDNNADVFYQVAGGSGKGLFQACQENKTWAIGVDSDQYATFKASENPELADVILTSMLKEVGNSLVSIFTDIANGKELAWGTTIKLGLKESAVGYADNDYFKANVPQEIRDKMAAVKDDVISGKLTIKSYYDFANDDEYQAFVNAAAPTK